MSVAFGAIGSAKWPGLSKLTEEVGEVLQIIGKLVATNGESAHWDGTVDLRSRLVEEIADVDAALRFVAEKNGLDLDVILARSDEKYALFCKWHEATKNEERDE